MVQSSKVKSPTAVLLYSIPEQRAEKKAKIPKITADQ